APAERWAEKIGMFSDSVFKCSATAGQFSPDCSLALEGQQGMGEGVISNNVAGLHNFADDFGLLLNVASDEKESCVHVLPGEDFEQAQRVWIVGPVVVGERELPGSTGEAGEGAAIPLPGGRHRLVARCRQRCSGGRSREYGSEHGRILKDCRLK